MDNSILETLIPLALTGITALLGFLTPAVRRWLDANAANMWVRIGRDIVLRLVMWAEQALGDAEGYEKKNRVVKEVARALKPHAKEIETATGQSLADFIDSEVEAAAYQKKQAKIDQAARLADATKSVGPRSTV